jgi:hypothetical protein
MDFVGLLHPRCITERDTVSVCGMDKIKDLRAIYSDNDNVSSTLLLLATGAELFCVSPL